MNVSEMTAISRLSMTMRLKTVAMMKKTQRNCWLGSSWKNSNSPSVSKYVSCKLETYASRFSSRRIDKFFEIFSEASAVEAESVVLSEETAATASSS